MNRWARHSRLRRGTARHWNWQPHILSIIEMEPCIKVVKCLHEMTGSEMRHPHWIWFPWPTGMGTDPGLWKFQGSHQYKLNAEINGPWWKGTKKAQPASVQTNKWWKQFFGGNWWATAQGRMWQMRLRLLSGSRMANDVEVDSGGDWSETSSQLPWWDPC